MKRRVSEMTTITVFKIIYTVQYSTCNVDYNDTNIWFGPWKDDHMVKFLI